MPYSDFIVFTFSENHFYICRMIEIRITSPVYNFEREPFSYVAFNL